VPPEKDAATPPENLNVQFPKVSVPLKVQFVHVLPKTLAISSFHNKVSQRGGKIHFKASLQSGEPLPSWLSFKHEFEKETKKNELSFRGVPPKVESLHLRVEGTTPAGQTVSILFPFEVSANPPYVNKVLKDVSGTADEEVLETIPKDAIVDPDGGEISYSAKLLNGSDLPPWLHFDAKTLQVRGTPPDEQDLTLTVKGTDPQQLSAQTSWVVRIGKTRPPLISESLPDIRGVVGKPIYRKIPEGVIVDPMGTRLTFTAFEEHGELPEWLKFDPKTMTFTGVPPEPQGLHVYVKGTTEDGLSGHSPLNVLVASESVNDRARDLISMMPMVSPPAIDPPPYCVENDVMYEPIDMNMTITNITAKTVVDCMIQCRNAPDCGYFSFYFPLKVCHFSSPMATKATGRIGFVGGGAICPPNDPQGKAMVGMKQASVDSKFATERCGVRGLSFFPRNGQGRQSSYVQTALACQDECQNVTWCHSYLFNTLTKTCDLQDWQSKPVLGSIYDMAGPVFCSVDVYVDFMAKYPDDELSKPRPDISTLKAALKAGLALSSGRYPIYTEKKTNFYESDGNGAKAEDYIPLIHVDEIFLTKRGEDAHSVNFSAILALPGRRALYMVSLLKNDPEAAAQLRDAMSNLTIKMEHQLHVNLPDFSITHKRLKIVGDSWREKMTAMANKEFNLTDWIPKKIGVDDIGAYEVNTGDAPASPDAPRRGRTPRAALVLGTGAFISMILAFIVARRGFRYTKVDSRPGMDSILLAE